MSDPTATATSGATNAPQNQPASRPDTKPATGIPPAQSLGSGSGGGTHAAGKEARDSGPPVKKVDLSKFKDLSNEEFSELLKTRKHTAKVNGKAVELDYDSMVSGYQTHRAATEKFEAASKERKDFEAKKANFDKEFLTDPVGALQKAGKSPTEIRDYMEEYLADVYQNEEQAAKNPHLAKMKAIEAENAKLRAEAEDRGRRDSEIETSAARDHWVQTYDQQLGDALSGSGLPAQEAVVKAVVNYMKIGLENDQEISAAQAVEWVKQDMQGMTTGLMEKMTDEQLLAFLPPSIVKRIGLASISKLRAKRQAGYTSPQQTGTRREKEPTKGKNMDDFFNGVMKRVGGK